MSRTGPGPAEHAAGDGRVVRGAAALQIGDARPRQPEVPGSMSCSVTAPRGHLPDVRVAGGRQLVQPVVAAEHQRGRAAGLEDAHDQRRPSPARATPTAFASGRAGLHSGPRKLNTVGTPSSRARRGRVLEAGMEGGREHEGEADLVEDLARRARVARSGRCRVRASTSLEPDAELAALLPCLTTFAPAAAATTEAIVEMLTVLNRSPPVPTMSTTRADSERGRVCRGSRRGSRRSRRPSRPWRAAPPGSRPAAAVSPRPSSPAPSPRSTRRCSGPRRRGGRR